jgi:hypothetical protein
LSANRFLRFFLNLFYFYYIVFFIFFFYLSGFFLFILGGYFESERVVGYEVVIKLARWQHAAGSTIAPRRFYRLAGEQI